MKAITIRSFWPAIVMLIIATGLFCTPGDRLPDDDWLGKISIDKFAHVGLFGALVALWGMPFIARSTSDPSSQRNLARTLTWIVVIAVVYGVAIEFIQGAFIPNRSYSLADMVADALGCAAGFAWLNRQRKLTFDSGS